MLTRADLNQAAWHTHLSKDLIKGLQDKLHKAPLGAAGWGLFGELSSKEEKKRVMGEPAGRRHVTDPKGESPKFWIWAGSRGRNVYVIIFPKRDSWEGTWLWLACTPKLSCEDVKRNSLILLRAHEANPLRGGKMTVMANKKVGFNLRNSFSVFTSWENGSPL